MLGGRGRQQAVDHRQRHPGIALALRQRKTEHVGWLLAHAQVGDVQAAAARIQRMEAVAEGCDALGAVQPLHRRPQRSAAVEAVEEARARLNRAVTPGLVLEALFSGLVVQAEGATA